MTEKLQINLANPAKLELHITTELQILQTATSSSRLFIVHFMLLLHQPNSAIKIHIHY